MRQTWLVKQTFRDLTHFFPNQPSIKNIWKIPGRVHNTLSYAKSFYHRKMHVKTTAVSCQHFKHSNKSATNDYSIGWNETTFTNIDQRNASDSFTKDHPFIHDFVQLERIYQKPSRIVRLTLNKAGGNVDNKQKRLLHVSR